MSTPTIVVHGGAGAYKLVGNSGITVEDIQRGVREAAEAGYKVLQESGGTALEAAQAAVVCMEDDPIFNAGVGSYLTEDKTIEMDAILMDGRTLRTGAVACVTNVRNPVKVARVVLDQTPHTMVCGPGALSLAKKHGLETASTVALSTDKALRSFENNPKFGGLKASFHKDPNEHDTVGAVALDTNGDVAVATSTGGITGKMSGRVGDSPIVGAGCFADNASGAVCSTGEGEAMVRVCTCKHAALLMEQGASVQSALDTALDVTRTKGKGLGGCVGVSSAGEIGVSFNTQGMAWISIQGGVVRYGMYPGDAKTLT